MKDHNGIKIDWVSGKFHSVVAEQGSRNEQRSPYNFSTSRPPPVTPHVATNSFASIPLVGWKSLELASAHSYRTSRKAPIVKLSA